MNTPNASPDCPIRTLVLESADATGTARDLFLRLKDCITLQDIERIQSQLNIATGKLLSAKTLLVEKLAEQAGRFSHGELL